MIGMARYPDKFFDLAIVDPPYGINVSKMAYTTEENRASKQKNGTLLMVKRSNYKHGDWDKQPPPIEYFTELRRISINQIIWGWNYYGLDWGPGLIRWNKMHPDTVTFSKYEYAYCSLLDREIEIKILWSGMMQAKSISEPTIQQGNKRLNEKRIHPTQKPIMLYKLLLQSYAQPGNKILDTHMGSQSSRIAAYQMGFDYTGFEIDREYFEAGNKRFLEQTAQLKLL